MPYILHYNILGQRTGTTSFDITHKHNRLSTSNLQLHCDGNPDIGTPATPLQRILMCNLSVAHLSITVHDFCDPDMHCIL